MHISPISYRSNPQNLQTFTSNEVIKTGGGMSRRTFLKVFGLGTTALVIAPSAVLNAQNAAENTVKPAVFAKESFELVDDIGEKQTLTFRVANRKGQKDGFDVIWAELTNSKNTADGKVGVLLDIPEKSIQEVLCYTFDGKPLFDTGNKNVFGFVKKWVSSRWNKSDIIIDKSIQKAVKTVANLK